MSFGFSPSDIFALVNVARKTYRGWKTACGEYADITTSLVSLLILLERIEDEAEKPHNAIVRNKRDAADLGDILNACGKTVHELNAILTKFQSLGAGKSREKNWDRIRFGNKNLDSLKSKLQLHETALSVYLNTVGLSTLARVEGQTNALSDQIQKAVEALTTEIRTGSAASRLEQSLTLLPQKIQQTVDGLAKDINSGRREGSIMTTYQDDETEVWRQFRRELIGEGFRSSEIHKLKPRIKLYLRVLAEKGLLEEAEMLEEHSTQNADPASSSAHAIFDMDPQGLSPSASRTSVTASLDGTLDFAACDGRELGRNDNSQIKASPEAEIFVNPHVHHLASRKHMLHHIGLAPEVEGGPCAAIIMEGEKYAEDSPKSESTFTPAPASVEERDVLEKDAHASPAPESLTNVVASNDQVLDSFAPVGRTAGKKNSSEVSACQESEASVAVHIREDQDAMDSAASELKSITGCDQVEEHVERGEQTGSVHGEAFLEISTEPLATSPTGGSQNTSNSPSAAEVCATRSDNMMTAISEEDYPRDTTGSERGDSAKARPAGDILDDTFFSQKPSKKPMHGTTLEGNSHQNHRPPACETESEGDDQYRPDHSRTPNQSDLETPPSSSNKPGLDEEQWQWDPIQTRVSKHYLAEAALEKLGYTFTNCDREEGSYFLIDGRLSEKQWRELAYVSRNEVKWTDPGEGDMVVDLVIGSYAHHSGIDYSFGGSAPLNEHNLATLPKLASIRALRTDMRARYGSDSDQWEIEWELLNKDEDSRIDVDDSWVERLSENAKIYALDRLARYDDEQWNMVPRATNSWKTPSTEAMAGPNGPHPRPARPQVHEDLDAAERASKLAAR